MAPAAASFWWCVPSGAVNSKPWLPAYQIPGRPTRPVTSARSRPLSTATGQCAANRCSALTAPAAGRAESGSSTMSDSVPSKSKNTAGCQAEGLQCIGKLRHPSVPGSHRDFTQVGDNRVGAEPVRLVTVPRPVDPDDQCESTIACGRDTGRVIRDDDAPAGPRAQPAGGLDRAAEVHA